MKTPSFFRKLSHLIPRRIWVQIFLLLTIFVVIPLIILGYLLIHTSQNAVKSAVLQDYKEIVFHASREVEEHFSSIKRAFLMTASILGTLNISKWQQESVLVELSLRYPIFKKISAFGINGEEISTSELGKNFEDIVNTEAFKNASSGKFFVSEVRLTSEHLPVLTMAAPLHNMDEILGVLIAEVDLRGIWDIVDSIKIGLSGHAYLVDSDGKVIARPDKKKVLLNGNFVYPEIMRLVLKGEIGSQKYITSTGESFLVAYAPIHSLHCGLVILHPEREAYAFLEIMKIQSWILILLSVIAAVAISWLISRLMSRPIYTFIEGTHRLARGGFDYPFRIRRRDDIGRLLYSLNRLAVKMRKDRELEKMSAIGKVATAIAHELKNSLLLIETFIRLIPERHKDKGFVREFSEIVPNELDSWNTMLRNIVEYGSMYKLSLTETHLNSLIRDIIALSSQKIRQEGIHLKVTMQKDIPVIMVDVDKLKRALLNLLINSIEAAGKEGTIIIITTRTKYVSGEYAEMRITNTGGGMNISDLKEMFEPFYSTKKDGFGLGLSISKEIIDRHGGEIDAVSDMGTVTFIVRIPSKSTIAGMYRMVNREYKQKRDM